MAKYSSKDCGFHLLGGYSLLGSDSKYEDIVELKLGEAYVLGDADEAYWSSGQKKTTVTQEGWFDDATNSVHEAFKSLPTTPLPMCIAPHGNTNAKQFDVYQSVQRVGYTVQLTVNDIHKANGEYGIWYGKKNAYIVHALGTETTAGNSDTLDVDLGTQPMTTNGGYAVVHVTAVSGFTGSQTVTITLRHSTDGVTYSDKQACTAIQAQEVPATSANWTAFTGTLNRYVSAAWAYSGGSGQSVTFMLGVYPAP